jgi:hypothetical protein
LIGWLGRLLLCVFPLQAAVSLFARLISHQAAVLFSQNEPATSQQYSSLRTNQHQPPANRTGSRLGLQKKAPLQHQQFFHVCRRRIVTEVEVEVRSREGDGVEQSSND